MNRDCHGDFFTFEGERYYCCFLDSTIVRDQPTDEPCRGCGRAIVPTEAGDVSGTVQNWTAIRVGTRTVWLPKGITETIRRVARVADGVVTVRRLTGRIGEGTTG